MLSSKRVLLRSSILAAAGAVAWLGLASEGLAQTSSGGDTTVEELVVTAGRREENLQDVPVAVAAIGSGELQSAGVQNFADLANITPSLSVVSGPGGNYLNIRGVGIGVGTPFQAAGVPLHSDGMYLPRAEQFMQDAYFDLESVEIYRGPQGTFAGQNSTGGAIFVVSKQPSFSGFDASIQQLVGTDNWYQTQGFVNLPISEKWAARFAINAEWRDGFYKNLGAGGPGVGGGIGTAPGTREGPKDPGNIDRVSLRGILRYQPTERADIKLRYDYIRETTNGAANFRSIPFTFNDPEALTVKTLNYDFPAYSKLEVKRVVLNTQWDVGEWAVLKTMTGYQDFYSSFANDTDATSPYVIPTPPCGTPALPATCAQGYGGTLTTDEYWIQEVDLVSAGDGPLQWVVGGVYLHQDTPIHTFNGNYTTDPNVLNGNSPPPGGGSLLDYYQEHKSWGVFGQVTYDITDQFQVIVGGRWTYDKIELLDGSTVRYAQGVNPGGTPPQNAAVIAAGFPNVAAYYASAFGDATLQNCGTQPSGLPNPCNVYGVKKSDAPSGRIAVNWFPTEDITVYASVSKGFKPGGYQTQFTLQAAGPQQGYKEESIIDYEAGIKTSMLDGRLRANLNGFWEKYEDYQASFRVAGVAIPRSINIDEAEIKGFEAEVSGVFGQLRFDANVGYSDTEITKNSNAPVVPASQFSAAPPGNPSPQPYGNVPANVTLIQCNPAAPTPVPGCLQTVGLPLNYAPKWTYNFSAEYEFQLPNGATLTPRAQYSYVGEQWTQLFHASQDHIGSRKKLDLRLTYKAEEHWRVEAFVLNATDEVYVTGVSGGAGATPYQGLLSLGAPRQYGLRIQYNY